MTTIKNPILPGFNPDPSICRVEGDFYIATSTFEWFPGVQIHHSRDLVNWRLAGRPLTRASQLDMRGDPDSGGIWAPCLSWSDGLFWLIYTDMKRKSGNYKDCHNYLVTAPSIEGPWSDPVYLNSSGFDPSLFHDDDGRKWLVNLTWDQRNRPSMFAGILLQEYSDEEKRLTGPITNIFRGTELGLTEGPHLYKRDGWYYLIVAEGGTGYNHAVTHARSRNIDGPYEIHPDTYVITSKDAPDAPLQRAGHGQFIEFTDGSVYHTHLCSRPLPETRLSPLGRESAIQRCVWGDDGWLRLEHGGPVPALEVEAPNLPEAPVTAEPERHEFDTPELPIEFQWLRTPFPDRLFSLTERPGWLRLFGRESIGSLFEQALVARRQTSFRYRAETSLEFQPVSYQQVAGMTAYYNSSQFHFLAISANDEGGRILTIMSCPGDWQEERIVYPLEADISLPPDGLIRMRCDVDGRELQFRYAIDDGDWIAVGPVLDAGVLADETGRGKHGCFTGAFVGMAVQDTSGRALFADFDHFVYRNL